VELVWLIQESLCIFGGSVLFLICVLTVALLDMVLDGSVFTGWIWVKNLWCDLSRLSCNTCNYCLLPPAKWQYSMENWRPNC